MKYDGEVFSAKILKPDGSPSLPNAELSLQQADPLSVLGTSIGGSTSCNSRFIREVQIVLSHLVGKEFGTFEQNQAVCTAVQNLMNRLGQAAECPRCGNPSKIRCLRSGRSRAGSFQFDHVIEGARTTHGGSNRFPEIKLIPAPSDKRLRTSRQKKSE